MAQNQKTTNKDILDILLCFVVFTSFGKVGPHLKHVAAYLGGVRVMVMMEMVVTVMTENLGMMIVVMMVSLILC